MWVYHDLPSSSAADGDLESRQTYDGRDGNGLPMGRMTGQYSAQSSQGINTSSEGQFNGDRTDRQYVNIGDENQMEIYGYKRHRLRTVITWIGIILTVGFLRLFFYWLPHLYLKATHVECDMEEADSVLLRDQHMKWWVHPVLTVTSQQTSDAAHSEKDSLKMENVQKSSSVQKLHIPDRNGNFLPVPKMRYFQNKKVRYIWEPESQSFQLLRTLDSGGVPCSYFYTCNGLSPGEQANRRTVFGENLIRVRVWPLYEILFREVLTPFYVFQVFSCLLWYFDEYMYYATCIVVVSIMSLSWSCYTIRKMQQELRNKVVAHDIVTVWRGKHVYETIEADLLVPGDVVVIPSHGCHMQCDAVLISGNCIVNESMLTGESVPVTKTPLPNMKLGKAQGDSDEYYNVKAHSRHTLFSGTRVIQTRYYGNERVLAVVVRTGFRTSKGELVRSIMFPKPMSFKFNRHTYYFILALGGCSLIGLIYTFIVMSRDGEKAGHMIIRALDLITIAVPPALPAAMTIGIAYARQRLKSRNIYCLSQNQINVCGVINAVCFDKTGTLTEDGLDMWGVAPAVDTRFTKVQQDCTTLPHGPLLSAMATCHSLTIIDNELCGDPLDLKMFQATGWELEEPAIADTAKFDQMMPTVVRPTAKSNDGEEPYEIGIVRQFTFSSNLQRMSVITRTLGATGFELYTKGAPEMIISLCRPETVPADFTNTLRIYTQQGYRVIALSWKPLPDLKWVKAQRIVRDQLEHSLTFLGLLVMENRLKQETTPVIKILQDVSIRTVMITGDNMLTALSVARDCHMVKKHEQVILVKATPEDVTYSYAENPNVEIKSLQISADGEIHDTITDNCDTKQDFTKSTKFHFALTGSSFEYLRVDHPETLPRVVLRGTVYARMSPEQKAQLIEHIQDLGYNVAMCGDGANDCGALKMAHAGISLSEAEASVASPFTSLEQNIKCVPTVVREGRAALVTSFGMFKYMACYSLTQFVSVMMLYWIGNNLTDFQFLWIDMFLLMILGVFFGRTAAYPILVTETPPASLMSATPLLSVFLQMLTMTAFQVFMFFFVKTQPWFVPFERNEEEEYQSYENTSVFNVSQFQYIILAFVFSKGAPYRLSILTNRFFFASLVILTLICIYITIYPHQWLINVMELQPAPEITYNVLTVGISLINFLICLIFEMLIVDLLFFRILKNKYKFLQRQKYDYQLLEKELEADSTWPPVELEREGKESEQCPKINGSTSSMTDDSAISLEENHSNEAVKSRSSPVLYLTSL